MTRINAGIPPKDLSDKHLLAEHREIKRIPNHIRKHRPNVDNIPKEFCLGRGHVTFFFDKGLYLYKRYLQIYHECIRRGFKVTSFGQAWDIYGEISIIYYKDWIPTPQAIALIEQRIKERS